MKDWDITEDHARPECVSRALQSLKIALNDKQWSSPASRAKGLRRLGIAQLGSRDDKEFVKRVAALAIRTCVPVALRAAASTHKDPKHKQAMLDAANKCEREATHDNAREARAAAHAANAAAVANAAAAANAANAANDANDAYAAAYAAAAAAGHAAAASTAKKSARDKVLADFAEGVVQILIDMKAPGMVK